ncbi:hypothetical protein FMEAI12_5150038 [Parafrankia sp. Ea1.12]|nr:hypothetical protein FMEAI12_5150038 [Parafrankia sp. Ea1.12]
MLLLAHPRRRTSDDAIADLVLDPVWGVIRLPTVTWQGSAR